jgi:putative nucleotidyltransferase with HDIG domain
MGDPNKGLYYVPRNYSGRILNGYYSVELKRRLVDAINSYQAFEETGIAGIFYIAAWQSQEKQIWYEYASQSFLELLGCTHAEVADVFRNAVVDRRIYKTLEADPSIYKQVQNRAEMDEVREALREESKKEGAIEAVYKIVTRDGRVSWVKDQANIEFHFRDRVSLSLGMLTVVSKEMEAEDELKRHHDHLESMVLKRTSELTLLNKQLKQEIVERKLAEYKLKQSYNQLENNLDEMVRAMSLTVEERDPYTAGHQRRTTELAVALAKEMGLSEHQCKGLRMAGLIHDMGKIAIPAEILSKPVGLNTVEFQLIKRHPQVGYDILKQFDFPWAVDQIVLQHHERLNGSGYPHGLAGENILLEARILCIADVVETIESHRPYRPGRGIDVALQEIRHNRGTLYDPEGVDACLALFTSKNFQYS